MLLNDYTLRGFEIRVAASLSLANESAAGQTSSSSRVNQGIKPKELTVSMMVKFENADQLAELTTVATALDEAGGFLVYDIQDSLARAMNIKQVQFVGTLNVTEVDSRKVWRVVFKLAEYLSVPEITESRQATTAPDEQTAEGEAVASVEVEPEAEQLTGFESVLKKLDNALA